MRLQIKTTLVSFVHTTSNKHTYIFFTLNVIECIAHIYL